MTSRKRHIRQAIVEQLSIGDTVIPGEAQESWRALKSYISGFSSDTPAPTKRELQDIYELILGYQVFIAGAYRVTNVAPPETEKRDPGTIDPADIPWIVLP